MSSALVHFKHSSHLLVTYAISQEYLLVTILVNIYFILLHHFISNSSVSFHTYANDIKLYVKCTENKDYLPGILSYTITTIHNWLTTISPDLQSNLNQCYLPTVHFIVKLFKHFSNQY